MKQARSKTLLRILVAVFALAMLFGCMTGVAMAATSTQWTTNAGKDSLVNNISNEEFAIIGPRNNPTEFFSYDAATTDVNANISTTDISFDIAIDAGTEAHGDFYGIFVFRISDPSSGIWGPTNAGLSVQFNSDIVQLRRWSRGIIDEEHVQTLQMNVVDGQTHHVSIDIDEYTVTVYVDDQSMTAEYAFIPGSGGYQFMAYNATVHVSNFEDGTTAGADPQPTDPQPTETQPTETQPQETQPQPTETQPQETQSQPTQSPDVTDPGESDDSLYITIAVVAVVVCVVIGLGYFLIVNKKKK